MSELLNVDDLDEQQGGAATDCWPEISPSSKRCNRKRRYLSYFRNRFVVRVTGLTLKVALYYPLDSTVRLLPRTVCGFTDRSTSTMGHLMRFSLPRRALVASLTLAALPIATYAANPSGDPFAEFVRKTDALRPRKNKRSFTCRRDLRSNSSLPNRTSASR